MRWVPVVLTLVVGACGSFGTTSSPRRDAISDASSAPDREVVLEPEPEPTGDPIDASADVEQVPPPRCTPGITDEFERETPDNPDWSPSQTGGATLSIVNGGVDGKALRAFTPGNAGGALAFLRRGLNVTAPWNICLSFQMKVVSAPNINVVSGPRVLAWDSDISQHQRVGIDVSSTSLLFQQNGPGSCPGTCIASKTSLVDFMVGRWHAIVVKLDLKPDRTAPPYGTWDVWIDGHRFAGELGVALASPAQRELRVGLSYGSEATAELLFDSVISSL